MRSCDLAPVTIRYHQTNVTFRPSKNVTLGGQSVTNDTKESYKAPDTQRNEGYWYQFVITRYNKWSIVVRNATPHTRRNEGYWYQRI